MPQEIIFDGVSKFYGEILGVNRVTLRIPPGTVKSRLFQARKTLRQFFDEGDER